jgi:thiosulfate/3-mercaptopyruvate sulfurtransferase
VSFVNPLALVETDWLAPRLGDPGLRVLECTAFLHPQTPHGYRVESGRAAWATGHIPRSGFADLTDELCDRTSPLRFMLPSPSQFAEAMGRLGVGDGVRVVLYDRTINMWAARVWWMLRAFGFDNAAVLNGGWRKWTIEGRPVSADPSTSAPGRFIVHPRPELFTDKTGVLAALSEPSTCVVNALTEEQHRGSGGANDGRPGRISGSVNVPASALVDRKTHAYLDLETLRTMFAAVGALDASRVITYCGGGIAASSDAFILTLLGHEHVAVYDASLSEWAADPALPMDTG